MPEKTRKFLKKSVYEKLTAFDLETERKRDRNQKVRVCAHIQRQSALALATERDRIYKLHQAILQWEPGEQPSYGIRAPEA